MRKNRILAFALAALVGTGLASCSKDPMDANNPNADQKGKFTFVLPSQGGVVTYAGEVAASANEKKLDLTKTSIFMFSDDDNTLEAIIPGTDITAGTNPAGKPTATIEIIDGWEGDKTFYIVGNTDQGADASLATAVVGTTTTTQFQDLITASQGTTLISSANGLLLAGNVPVANIEQTPSSDVTLYRSVARFDVNQDITLNKVKIKSIDVINANLNGYIDAYGRSVKTSGLTKGDLNNIAVSQTTVVEDVAGVDHTFQKQESVFYLYPTKLKANNAAGTEILLVGEVNGVEAIYTLNKEASDLVTDCEILANTRYIISAIDVLTHTFTITVAEWNEGEALIGRKNGSNFGIAAASAITNGTFNATYNAFSVTDPTAAFSAALTVKGSSTNGVSAQVISTTGVGLIEVGSDVITATAVYDGAGVTYATPYFGYNVTISFDADKIAADKNFTTIVRMTDKASGATVDVTIYYGGANVVDEDSQTDIVFYNTGAGLLRAVKANGLWWAPVNVGATQIKESALLATEARNLEFSGYSFQWARNYGIVQTIPTVKVQGGITYEDIDNYASDNTFILSLSDKGYWLNHDDPNADAVHNAWANATDIPCPAGWRLPSKEECDQIASNYLTNKTVSGYYYVYLGDVAGEKLYFPGAGIAGRTSGVAGGSECYLWTGTMSSIGTEELTPSAAYCMRMGSSTIDVSTYGMAAAMPIRCVKDAE